jgi:hypothetical protein
MRALPAILSLSTFLVVGCQVVGGFEDFTSVGNLADPTAGAGGAADSAGAGGADAAGTDAGGADAGGADAGGNAGAAAGGTEAAGTGGSDAGAGGTEAAGMGGTEAAGAGGTAGAGNGGAGPGGAGPEPCPQPTGALAGLGLVATQRFDGSCFFVQRLETNVGDYRQFIMQQTTMGTISKCPGAPVVPQCSDGSCGTPGSQDCSLGTSCSCPQCWMTARCTQPDQTALPVVCVSQCGARAYCESRGLRLCQASELQALCAEDGNQTQKPRAYPYGDAYMPGKCEQAPPLHEPGQNDCSTPNGARDVLGNVSEWTACEGGGPGSSCTVWGAKGAAAGTTSTCQNYMYSNDPNSTRDDLGIRCCADAPKLTSRLPKRRTAFVRLLDECRRPSRRVVFQGWSGGGARRFSPTRNTSKLTLRTPSGRSTRTSA